MSNEELLRLNLQLGERWWDIILFSKDKKAPPSCQLVLLNEVKSVTTQLAPGVRVTRVPINPFETVYNQK